MTDDSPGQQSALERDPFQTWVASLSASKGASREEVLEQLISSYWTLHELLQVIEESGDDVNLYPSTDDDPAPKPGTGGASLAGFAEADVDAGETSERLAERIDVLAEDFEDRWETLSEHQHAVEAYVTGEFDDVRTVLEYLIETTDALAERTEALLSEHVEATRRRRAERSVLVDLKNEAGRKGVTTADCDHCGTSVALGTLATPRCPQCASTFDGVVAKSGWLDFGPNRLTVADDPEPHDSDEPVDERLAGGGEPSKPGGLGASTDALETDGRAAGVGEPASRAADARAADDRFQWLDENELS